MTEKQTLFKEFNNKRYNDTYKSKDILGQSMEKPKRQEDGTNLDRSRNHLDRSFNQINKSQNRKITDNIVNHDIFEIGRQSYLTTTN